MGERARTFALVVCMVLLATLLAGLSARLPQSGVTRAAVTTTVTKTSPSGTLLVSVVMNEGPIFTTAAGLVIHPFAMPVANANISISSPSSGPLTPYVFQTNSSGEVALSIAAGSYTVLVSASQFQKAVGVSILANMTTEVDATVTRVSYPALFSDLPDPETSGSVAPWSYISVAVGSSPRLALNDSIFIEGFYGSGDALTQATGNSTSGSGTIFGHQAETPALLISSDLDAPYRSQILWVTLQPESFIQLSGLVSLSLATYTANLQVSTYAT